MPGHGRYFSNDLIAFWSSVALYRSNKPRAGSIVDDDDVCDQPAALVGDPDVKVSGADQLLLAADL
jgi:hypothetical protein